MTSDDDTVVVTGTGRASAAPDVLVLDLRLEGHGPTVGEALSVLSRASRAAHDALPDQRLRTHGLGIHPRHDRQGERAGHTAYQSLQVRTDDPEAAGALVQRLGEAVGDGLGVEGLRHEVADPSGLQRQARERAFGDAVERAEQYAELAGRVLLGVRSVREPAVGGPRPLGDQTVRAVMAAGPVVDPAEHEVTAVVEVTWQLEV